LINVYWNEYGLIQTDTTNDIVVYSFLAWLITQSITIHSVHLPFQCIVYMTKKIRIILLILDFKLGTIDNRKDYLQTWGEFFFFIIIFFLDKNRNTGFSSRHLLRLQKFCMNSRFRTGIFWIQWYRFDFAFILVI
jgi:hypothetical protein